MILRKTIMTKIKITIISSIILVFIVPGIIFSITHFTNSKVLFPCACVTTAHEVESLMAEIQDLIVMIKNKTGTYPTYKQLKTTLQKSENYSYLFNKNNNPSDISLIEYSDKLKLKGNSVCYKLSTKGKGYILKGYAVGEYKGKKVIADIINHSKFINFDEI